MARYNTFLVYDCKKRKNLLITSSARKAKNKLCVGTKIEVWNDNSCIEVIYAKDIKNLGKYINLEKEYIGSKQSAAELKNKRRKNYES